MAKIGKIGVLVVMLAAVLLLPATGKAASKVVYVGGSFPLTGAYAENTAAALAAFEDYVKYVNETKRMAPWSKDKFPADVTLEVLWRDDELKPAKALSIYEELKSKGILVYRVGASAIALALKDRLNADKMGCTSMAAGAFLLTPPQTILTHYPIYTDSLAAIAEWFKGNWKENRKPRLAYLTADNAMGKSLEIPEMDAYMKKLGYDLAGIQYVPLVPTTPPTTQLMWLKQNKVDLALGIMINPGAQATMKEALRLGMGPNLDYKITVGMPNTTQMADFFQGLGAMGNGFVSGGSFPAYSETSMPGVAFALDLQKKYRQKREPSNVYLGGLIEVMTQVEALRLALKVTPAEKLKREEVLKEGFFRIKNLDTGGLSSTPLTYTAARVEGVDAVRVDQVQNGKIVKLGTWPCRNIYTR